jgi:hypothetical protein
MNDELWINDISILWKNGKYLEFYPTANMTSNEKTNSITRFFIYVIILVLLFSGSKNLIYIALVIIVFLVLISMPTNESFSQNYLDKLDNEYGINQKPVNPTIDNPFMNVSLLDYYDNPNRGPASKDNNELLEKYFNKNFYFNVRDPFERKFVERSFYTMPVTTIPNDQTGFAESLFKKSESCKENTANCYRYEDLRFNQTNPAIDVHREVFNANPFGDLS